MSLLFNMLSRLVIAFLQRTKCLLISWLQSPSAVILEPKKIKSVTVSSVSPYLLWSHPVTWWVYMEVGTWIQVFLAPGTPCWFWTSKWGCRNPEIGTPWEGAQVFAARGPKVNRSLELSFVGYEGQVSFHPAQYRGQKPADGQSLFSALFQYLWVAKANMGVVESLLNE